MGINLFGYRIVGKTTITCAECEEESYTTYWILGAIFKMYLMMRHFQSDHPKELQMKTLEELVVEMGGE